MLGNSVWASSLVLAGFMAGLGLGNAWAARAGSRLPFPLRTYALLEVVVGLSGLGLVVAFPLLGRWLVPALRLLSESPLLLNAGRMGIGFALLLVPATAMGATLPLLVRTLAPGEPGFGRALGWLYGWNTLGAVAGALLGEALFVRAFGVRGTGAVAASFNLVAAILASALAREAEGTAARAEGGPVRAPLSPRARRVLGAALLAGATLLAFEVVWFRFLLLFFLGSSVTFANMLAAVLLGIGGGGLLASLWLRRAPRAAEYATAVALGASVCSVLTYAGLGPVLERYRFSEGLIANQGSMFLIALYLMLPTSALSGVLFTLLGDRLRPEAGDDTRAAGLLTLVNTIGAAAGALVGGLALLPLLGVERSVFALSLAYAVIALCVTERDRPLVQGVAWAFALAILALFPFGLMKNYYVRNVLSRWTRAGFPLVAYREGVTETVSYLEESLFGRPVGHRLVTNGFSMSSTGLLGQRYMMLFAHWAAALRPDARRALLISFGVGSTAKALTDTKSLRVIDVVDISRDILEMGRLVFPDGGYPLDDPRVRTHVEDGRYFLLTTWERFDIITAEPPPPKNAGIVSLYTREYFELVRSRLAEGGVATYWLPVYQMEPHEARAITRGFCDAFADCSLWTLSGMEWMLAGTRDLRSPVSDAGFRQPWTDPVVGRVLRDIGVESPEQLGALFIADGDALASWLGAEPPLVDDRPYRLDYRLPPPGHPEFWSLMDADASRERFRQSRFIREVWPEAVRAGTLPLFDGQRIVNRVLGRVYYAQVPPVGMAELVEVLTRTELRSPALWLMESSHDSERAAEDAEARGVKDPYVDELLGIRAMARRDYAAAEARLALAEPYSPHPARLRRFRILAAILSGDPERALGLLRGAGPLRALPDPRASDWTWLEKRLAAEGSSGGAAR